jgi:YegS/Rv2252/BmrU family lipid kinase
MLIIANPASGRGKGSRTAAAVAEHVRSRGVNIEVRHTTGAGDAECIAKEAMVTASRPLRCVVACGGDGTIQEIANVLAEARPSLGDACPALGLAPAGRCNDFARAFDIPTDPSVIAEVLLNGQALPTDLGRVNGRYFCTVATAGADADVSSFVDTMRMPLRGTLAYLYGAIRVLIRYRPYEMKITGDFGAIERPMLLASSANTSCYGGAIRIAPDADPTDGLLELCVVDRVGRLRAIALIPSLLAGRHGRCPAVHFLRTRRLTIESPQLLEIWADGERIAHTPATIEVVPAAIRVLRRV